MRSTSVIYLVVLKKGEVSPLAKESDEEKAEAADKGRPRQATPRAKAAQDRRTRRRPRATPPSRPSR